MSTPLMKDLISWDSSWALENNEHNYIKVKVEILEKEKIVSFAQARRSDTINYLHKTA